MSGELTYDDDGGIARSFGWEPPVCPFKPGDVVMRWLSGGVHLSFYVVADVLSPSMVWLAYLDGSGFSSSGVKDLHRTPYVAELRVR